MAICYRSALAQGGLKVDSLVVTTQPTKLTYIEGESVDLTGAVITATAGLLSGNVVSAVSVSPSVLTTPGTQTVTVSYGGEEATFTVTCQSLLHLRRQPMLLVKHWTLQESRLQLQLAA